MYATASPTSCAGKLGSAIMLPGACFCSTLSAKTEALGLSVKLVWRLPYGPSRYSVSLATRTERTLRSPLPPNAVDALPTSTWEQAMLNSLPSSWVHFVRPEIACLLIVYGVESGRGVWAEMDPLLMILPPWGDWLFICLTACWVMMKAARTLTDMTLSNAESGRASMATGGAPQPAFCRGSEWVRMNSKGLRGQWDEQTLKTMSTRPGRRGRGHSQLGVG